MPKLDIEKLDRYLRNAKIDPAGLRWLDPRDEKNFEVLGFYWFKNEKRWHRFPLKAERGLSQSRTVWDASSPYRCR